MQRMAIKITNSATMKLIFEELACWLEAYSYHEMILIGHKYMPCRH